MSNLIVLLLSVEFWSIMTHYCVINGTQYQRWLKIVSLTVSLLTDNCLVRLTHGQMINGKPYQFWTKLALLIVSLLIIIVLVYCDLLLCNQWNTISEMTKIVSLTVSLLTDDWSVKLTHGQMINGKPYQFWAKTALLIVSLLITIV